MNSRIFRCLLARIRPGEGEDSVKHFRAAIWEGLLASKPSAVRFRRFPRAAALGIKMYWKPAAQNRFPVYQAPYRTG